jgi:hypothetical protein
MIIQQLEKKWKQKWFQYILDHPEKDWNYGCLSENPNLTWEMVQTHPEKPWNYNSLSQNLNIKSS